MNDTIVCMLKKKPAQQAGQAPLKFNLLSSLVSLIGTAINIFHYQNIIIVIPQVRRTSILLNQH